MSRIKSETPVIYFYTPRVQRVQVEVEFPTGLWTQWYPQAASVAPGIVQAGSPPKTRIGRISWDVMVRPADLKHNEPPATASDALWNHARDVDAAYVVGSNQARPGSAEQWERFIFYRGLGEVPLPGLTVEARQQEESALATRRSSMTGTQAAGSASWS